jgi:hypothetical protein
MTGGGAGDAEGDMNAHIEYPMWWFRGSVPCRGTIGRREQAS